MPSHKRELLNWWAMSLWTHDKIPKAIGAEHIQFHDLRYAFAALSLKNRGGRKTVIFWGAGHYSDGSTLHSYTHTTP